MSYSLYRVRLFWDASKRYGFFRYNEKCEEFTELQPIRGLPPRLIALDFVPKVFGYLQEYNAGQRDLYGAEIKAVLEALDEWLRK